MMMTDQQFTETSRAITITVLEAMGATGATKEDAAAVVGFALLEALGHLLGSPAAAIERLRSIADIGEAQILGGDPFPPKPAH